MPDVGKEYHMKAMVLVGVFVAGCTFLLTGCPSSPQSMEKQAQLATKTEDKVQIDTLDKRTQRDDRADSKPPEYRSQYILPAFKEIMGSTYTQMDVTLEATDDPRRVLVTGNIEYEIGQLDFRNAKKDEKGVLLPEVKGTTKSMTWCPGARHTIKGTLQVHGYTFTSDQNNPLVFRLVAGQGYVYEKGQGTVITPSKERVRLGSTQPPTAKAPAVTVREGKLFFDNKPFEIRAELAPPRFWGAEVERVLAGLDPATNVIVTQRPVSSKVLATLYQNELGVFVGFRDDRAKGTKDISSGYYLLWIDELAHESAVYGVVLDAQGFDAATLERAIGYIHKLYNEHPNLRRLPVFALIHGVPSVEFVRQIPSADGLVLSLDADQVSADVNLNDIAKPMLVVRVAAQKPTAATR